MKRSSFTVFDMLSPEACGAIKNMMAPLPVGQGSKEPARGGVLGVSSATSFFLEFPLMISSAVRGVDPRELHVPRIARGYYRHGTDPRGR